MIDTVIIRLHNIKKIYSSLIKVLNMKDKTGFSVETAEVPDLKK